MTVHDALGAVALAPHRAQPAGRAIERDGGAGGELDRHAREPGRAHVDRLQRELDVLPARVRVPAPAPARLRRARPAPSPAARPASRRTAARRRASPRGGARSRREILRQVRPPARRVERGRDPLAPRRRAQPREVDDVGVARRGRRRASARPRRRARPGSRSARSAPAGAARRSPSSCPCGDHTIVARSRDHQRVDDRVELRQVALADQQLDALAPDRDRARARRVVGADPHGRRRACAAPARPRPATSRDGWKRPTRWSRFSISPRNSLSTITTMFITRAGTYARSSLWRCGEHACAAPPRSAPGVVSSSRQTSSMARAPASGAARSARRRPPGPPVPDA